MRGSMEKKHYNAQGHPWPRWDRAGQAGPYALGPECRTGRNRAVYRGTVPPTTKVCQSQNDRVGGRAPLNPGASWQAALKRKSAKSTAHEVARAVTRCKLIRCGRGRGRERDKEEMTGGGKRDKEGMTGGGKRDNERITRRGRGEEIRKEGQGGGGGKK